MSDPILDKLDEIIDRCIADHVASEWIGYLRPALKQELRAWGAAVAIEYYVRGTGSHLLPDEMDRDIGTARARFGVAPEQEERR